MPEKNEIKSGLKNLAMLPIYFHYIFGHIRQIAHLRPKLSRKFCQLEAQTDPKSPAQLITLVSMHQSA